MVEYLAAGDVFPVGCLDASSVTDPGVEQPGRWFKRDMMIGNAWEWEVGRGMGCMEDAMAVQVGAIDSRWWIHLQSGGVGCNNRDYRDENRPGKKSESGIRRSLYVRTAHKGSGVRGRRYEWGRWGRGCFVEAKAGKGF